MSRGRGGLRLKTMPNRKSSNSKSLVIDPLESDVQIAVIKWAEVKTYKGRSLAFYIHHSANGGYRDKREAHKFKRMGVQSGYPDLLVDIAKKGYHGLRIELKRSSNETLTDKQIERLKVLNEEGYYAVACKGFDEAIKTIEDYIK